MQLLMGVMEPQAQDAKAVEVVVVVVELQEQAVQAEPEVNPQEAVVEVVDQPTDQTLEPVEQVVQV